MLAGWYYIKLMQKKREHFIFGRFKNSFNKKNHCTILKKSGCTFVERYLFILAFSTMYNSSLAMQLNYALRSFSINPFECTCAVNAQNWDSMFCHHCVSHMESISYLFHTPYRHYVWCCWLLLTQSAIVFWLLPHCSTIAFI